VKLVFSEEADGRPSGLSQQGEEKDIVQPTGINQLYQASFTELRITNHPMHFALAVMDCFSRYLLVLRVSPSTTTQDLINGLDEALTEARQVSELGKDGVITLVTSPPEPDSVTPGEVVRSCSAQNLPIQPEHPKIVLHDRS